MDGTLFVNGWSVSSQVTNLIQQWTGWAFALAGRLIFIHDPGAQCVMPLDLRSRCSYLWGCRPFETVKSGITHCAPGIVYENESARQSKGPAGPLLIKFVTWN